MFAKRASILIVLLLAAVACSHTPTQIRVQEMQDGDSGLLYGQIVMPGKDWYMRHVMIQRVGKVYAGMGLKGVSEKIQVMPDGRFVAENLKPGKYMLGGFVIGDQQSFLGKAALEYQIELKPGAVQYFGSYKYVSVSSSNIIRPGKFELEKGSSPKAQAELLAWVEESARETQWHPKVTKELAKYSRHLGTK